MKLSKEELVERRNNLEKFAKEYLDLCKKYNIHIVSDCRNDDYIFVGTDALGSWENKVYEPWFKAAIKEELQKLDERISTYDGN
jgi:predicted secreted acid phosphatase